VEELAAEDIHFDITVEKVQGLEAEMEELC
jgi:hypothetical protein